MGQVLSTDIKRKGIIDSIRRADCDEKSVKCIERLKKDNKLALTYLGINIIMKLFRGFLILLVKKVDMYIIKDIADRKLKEDEGDNERFYEITEDYKIKFLTNAEKKTDKVTDKVTKDLINTTIANKEYNGYELFVFTNRRPKDSKENAESYEKFGAALSQCGYIFESFLKQLTHRERETCDEYYTQLINYSFRNAEDAFKNAGNIYSKLALDEKNGEFDLKSGVNFFLSWAMQNNPKDIELKKKLYEAAIDAFRRGLPLELKKAEQNIKPTKVQPLLDNAQILYENHPGMNDNEKKIFIQQVKDLCEGVSHVNWYQVGSDWLNIFAKGLGY